MVRRCQPEEQPLVRIACEHELEVVAQIESGQASNRQAFGLSIYERDLQPIVDKFYLLWRFAQRHRGAKGMIVIDGDRLVVAHDHGAASEMPDIQ